MSFTTRCPSCGTMFRVVADQLKISEGWVRCGHCADVFDATLYLQPWAPPAEEGATDHAAVPAPEPEGRSLDEELDAALGSEPAPAVAPVDELVEMMWSGEERATDERAAETLPPPLPMPASKGAVADDEESDFHAELERFAAGLGRLKADGVVPTVEEGVPAEDPGFMPDAPAPENMEPVGSAPSELETAEVVPGFVRQAQRQAFWQSPRTRAVLSLLVLVLAGLLFGQWAVHDRDRLAAWQPELQPLLQQTCSHLGCTVAPVRRIDAIVIDSASLVRRLGNFYSFDLVLKNTAPMALAVPALELSLTDIGGDVISRRVFLPEEWPDAPSLLPAQDSVTVNFRLSLALGDETPMAGYHALVFYP